MRYVWVVVLYCMVLWMVFICVNNAIAMDCSQAEAASYCSYMEDSENELRNSSPRNSETELQSDWAWPSEEYPNLYKLNTMKFEIVAAPHEQRVKILETIHELHKTLPLVYILPEDRTIWITVEDLGDKYAQSGYGIQTKNLALALDLEFMELSLPDRMVIILHEVTHIRLFNEGYTLNNECVSAFHEVVAYNAELTQAEALGISAYMRETSEEWASRYKEDFIRECVVVK